VTRSLTIPEAEAPSQAEPAATGRASGPERWLREHLEALAVAVTVAAFGLRVYAATRNYLNPDEALHYLIINQPSVWLTYKAGLTNAHPPLIYLVLHFWRWLGRSELMLRMPSVLSGTAACWFGFKWVKIVAGEAASLIALVFLAFSPGMVVLSAELRAYGLLLGCMTAALYFLARAFETKSAGQVWLFSLFLCLSILSHYSALFFTVAVGVYALARFGDGRQPRNVVAAWGAGQAGALALYGFLYVTHVSKLGNSIAVWSTLFARAYFPTAGTDIFGFTGGNTLNIFSFFFSERIVVWVLLLSFVAGVTTLFAGDLGASRRNFRGGGHLGILLLLPFLAVWGASLAGVYPYVGSRHTGFLAPFAIAGAAYFLSVVSRQQLSAGLLIAGLLMGLSHGGEKPAELIVSGGDDSPRAMSDAVHYMEAAIPSGSTILVDFQSSLPLTYYFCGPNTLVPFQVFVGDYFDFQCNGDSIVSLHNWKAAAPGFPDQFEKMARAHSLKPGDHVWFYQTGWGEPLDVKLDRQGPSFRCLSPRHFGSATVIIPFIVGPDFRPAAPSADCSN
jgi:dolichyl-phosphate-mannose-protein mannosyltransferase